MWTIPQETNAEFADHALLQAYRNNPGMVVVKEYLSTFYYRSQDDAKINHPPHYPVPAIPYDYLTDLAERHGATDMPDEAR